MKNVVNTLFLLLTTALMGVNCWGQVSFEDMANPPKNDTEAMKYIDKYLKPKINDTLIARLLKRLMWFLKGK
ncbi:MAG: hypothetical protein IPN25_00970 [Sphingobacteriales bacterium]|nr:hypothetical protein [Sphingobacteriales bacterium]